MQKVTDRTVLLFFKNFETDRWVPGDRYLKRIVRPLYERLHGRKKISGFQASYQRLILALQREGYEVHSNNYQLARRNPEYPVGLYGFPHLLDGWDLPNPAVLGRGLYDHPGMAPTLMQDPRYRSYLVGSEWVKRMFVPYYGDSVGVWFAGIDLELWADTRRNVKTTDVLVYDKVYFDREQSEVDLIRPILRGLAKRGLRVEVLRYGSHDHETYRRSLARSRAMLFLCAHETQGMACQEAMASNLPVLAWDQGHWLDLRRTLYQEEPVPATSVPYFSPECGERFRDIAEFDATFDRFWSRVDDYEPRRYVAREMSLKKSAEQYMKYYSRAA